MHASARKDASRLCEYAAEVRAEACAPPSADWNSLLGEVGEYDCYFVPVLKCGSYANFELDRWVSGKLFLKNLRGVHSLITRALLDSAVVTDAIEAHLSMYTPEGFPLNPYAVESNPDALVSVAIDRSPVDGVARPGHIEVTYAKASGTPGTTVRRVRFPTYADAGHEVAYASPRELFEDIAEFLCSWQ